jgi:hypothetical protein
MLKRLADRIRQALTALVLDDNEFLTRTYVYPGAVLPPEDDQPNASDKPERRTEPLAYEW